jgi:hypothetical protein
MAAFTKGAKANSVRGSTSQELEASGWKLSFRARAKKREMECLK